MNIISSNPADKVKRLKKNQFIGSYYTSDELNDLFEVVKGDLRHSCASLLLANGVSLKEIQAWLGYSHYSTTANIYVDMKYNSKLSSAQAMSNNLQIPSMQKAPESPQQEDQELIHC